MRYFLTINAARPAIAGGLTFTFEPVSNRGGSWLGVLAVEEDSAANTLAANLPLGVEEIDFDRYDGLKKKRTGTRAELKGWRDKRSRPVGVVEANVAVVDQSPTTRGVAISAPPVEEQTAAVTLSTTRLQPPNEPLLEEISTRRPRRDGAKAA